MTPEDRDVFVRIANHLNDGNIVQRELREALDRLPDRITVHPPAPRIRRVDLAWVALAAAVGGLVGASIARAWW